MTIDDDEFFPVFRVSVRTAARLIAYETGGGKGTEFPDEELAQFEYSDPIEIGGRPYSSTISAHEFATREPVGRFKAGCQDVERALIAAIDRGHLSAQQVRRNFDGDLDAAQTFLGTSEVDLWAERTGLSLGDLWRSYCDKEEELAFAALDFLEKQRFAAENATDLKVQKRRTSEMSEDDINAALLERFRDRATGHTPPHAPLKSREKTTYLNIIGALLTMMLERDSSGKTRSGFKDETAIKDGILVRFPKKSGLSERTLNDKFPEANRSLAAD